MGRWNGGYISNFHFYPFGVPITPTDLRVGEPTYPRFSVVIDLSSVLANCVLDFR